MAVTAIADNYLEQAFEVPDAVCFALIKNGGEVITKLQADTGAKVDIARATGKVTVSGSREAVTAAAVVIKDLLATNYSCVVAFDDADIVGAIVGKKGENIRKLQVRRMCAHASSVSINYSNFSYGLFVCGVSLRRKALMCTSTLTRSTTKL